MRLPSPRGIAMQTLPLHVGVAESVQFAEAEYVVITVAVATMVFPIKGTVKDITVGSSTEAVECFDHASRKFQSPLPRCR